MHIDQDQNKVRKISHVGKMKKKSYGNIHSIKDRGEVVLIDRGMEVSAQSRWYVKSTISDWWGGRAGTGF
jgi:hypothetical protein